MRVSIITTPVACQAIPSAFGARHAEPNSAGLDFWMQKRVRTVTPIATGSDPLLRWYARHGRSDLPWRRTRDPYAIVVSEFMLQQTQVARVVPIFTDFLERWPAFSHLAAASAGDVVRRWRGLGYNSRAVRLHSLAVAVVDRHGGTLPADRDALLALPGIGPYTAAAVRAFAFEIDDVAADVNVRRVVHRLRFGLEHPPRASAATLDAAAFAMLPPGGAHDWNSAMMDLGATVCTARAPKCLVCPLRDGCAAAPVDPALLASRARESGRRSPQERIPFEESSRFLRGRIVDRLRDVDDGAIAVAELQRSLEPLVRDRVAEIPQVLSALVADGLVTVADGRVRLR